jgi:hypothetical protein
MPLYFFFDPTLEQLNVVLIDAAILHEAEKLLESCEHCNGEGAEIPFDAILRGRHATTTIVAILLFLED